MTDFQMAMELLRAPIRPLMEDAQLKNLESVMNRRAKIRAGVKMKFGTARPSPVTQMIYDVLMETGVEMSAGMIKAHAKDARLALAVTENITALIKSHCERHETPMFIERLNPNFRKSGQTKWFYSINPEYLKKLQEKKDGISRKGA